MPRCLILGLVVLALVLGAAPSGRQAKAVAYIFQTDMTGAENVPAVETHAWGFFRFYFSDDRTEADVTLDVKGRDQTQLVGADIHRGPPGANGPVVLHLSDGGFIATAVHIKLTPEQLREMASGQWYASMKTTLHPDGELRGQILPPPDFLPQARPGAAARPPAQAPNPGGLGPPSTGDAGLAP